MSPTQEVRVHQHCQHSPHINQDTLEIRTPPLTGHLSSVLNAYIQDIYNSQSLLFYIEIFEGLQGALERLRGEEFTWDEDINFIQDTFGNEDFLALCDVNDGVAESQSFEQPVASLEEVMKEVYT